MASYHPKGLPNEMPGKASNTRWAAQRLWEFMEDPTNGIDEHKVIHYFKIMLYISIITIASIHFSFRPFKVIITVADADSDFHSVYFEGLTYKVCTTPDKDLRESTVWQSPIMHYKNYHSQPAVVKLCSLFVTQHELANLSDDSATPLPYSTYSLTSNLAKRVGGWDPGNMFISSFS